MSTDQFLSTKTQHIEVWYELKRAFLSYLKNISDLKKYHQKPEKYSNSDKLTRTVDIDLLDLFINNVFKSSVSC